MAHLAVLEAIADTVFGSLTAKQIEECESRYSKFSNPGIATPLATRQAFYKFKPSDVKGTGQLMLDYLNESVPADKIGGFKVILTLLSSSFGTLLLTGYFTPFTKLDQNSRELGLKKLENSMLADFQILFRVLIGLSAIHTFGTEPSIGRNPTWNAVKFFNDIPKAIAAETVGKIWNPTFVTPTNGLEYDIIIAGSGCGGGLMALQLSKEGYKVLVIEKAKYYHNSDYSYSEREGFSKLFETKGGFQTEDGAMKILAGAAWGGGSAVNWSASFQPPQQLRKEWADVYGLKHVLEPEFQKGIDELWKYLGVGRNAVTHNIPNQMLLDGCKNLGIPAETIDQNTGNQPHDCGFCTVGCPSGIKNSTNTTWLKDAAMHGCHFMESTRVDAILHNKNVANGVQVTKDGKQTVIKAKRAVVVSGGSLNSPALILRSKFNNLNTHVGKHLRLHPVSVVSGVFPDQNILPYTGSIMTAVSNHTDKDGYGYKLEVPASFPSIFALSTKWENSSLHKQRMLLWPQTSQIIILTRDKDSEGTIRIDGQGNPRVDWALGKFDENSMLDGVEKATKILLSCGAKEIFSNQLEVPSFFPNPASTIPEILASKELKEYIAKVRSAGMPARKALLFCAHQMGSCRMSSTASQGAVSPRGQLYGTQNVYVSDASVFPTASGVNPMITTYSMAMAISKTLKEDLAKKNAKL